MKKLMRIALLLLFSLVLVSCDGEVAITLDAPQNVTIQDGVLTWDPVTDATGYTLFVDVTSYTITATTYDLNTLGLAAGTYQVHIIATQGTNVSLPSTTLNYVVQSITVDSLYESALALMNPLYEPDMTIDDFDAEYEYRNYMQMSQMVYAYSIAAIEMGMTHAQALDLFDQVASTPMRMFDINNLTTLMDEIDSYAVFGLSSTDLATILYELAVSALSIHIDDLEDYVLEYGEEIVFAEANLATTQTEVTAAIAGIYSSLIVYASPEQVAMLDDFLTGEYEGIYYVLDMIYYIALDLRYNFEIHDPYYLEDGDQYVELFYNILYSAAVDNNTTLLDSFVNSYPLNPLYNLAYANENVTWAYRSLEERENELAIMNEIMVMIVAKKDMMIDSFAGVSDYLSLIYDTVPASMIALIDDFAETGELTMEEYFVIKDEVVNILLTTLPSSEDFGSVYTTLFTIAGAFDMVAFDDYLPYADLFGSVDHAILDIMLTFVGDVDQTTVEDVMAIVDGMVIPGEIVYDEYWQEWYYQDDTVDFEKAIELAVYVGNYLDAFKTDNALKFADLDALTTSAQVEELILMFGESVKDAMMLELSPEEYEQAAMIIDEVLANYDNFVAARDIANAIGMNVVDEFLSTSGQLLLDLFDVVNNGSGDLTDLLFSTAVESVVDQILNYNTAVTGELDLVSIQALLKLVKIPLKVQLSNEGTMLAADVDIMFNTLLVPVSTVIFNALTIEKQLFDAVDQIDVATQITGWVLTGDDIQMALAVLILDDVLSLVNETLIFSTITIVQNSILKNADVLALNGDTALDVDNMIAEVVANLNDLFDEIHAVALLDFTTATQVEIDRLHALFEMVFPPENPPV